MDRLEAMRLFAAVAEAGSFGAAARRLGVSAPVATRAVAALEERIGVRLLHRTTRAMRLSEAGTHFLADCRRILHEVEEAEAAAGGLHAEPRGTLAITAPAMFGRRHVAPIAIDFLTRHPAVSLRTLLVDRVVDLIDEGLDVAVRIAHLPDSTLNATRVGAVRRVVCAAPSYLAAHGAPARPADLSRHRIVTFAPGIAPAGWTFRDGSRNETVSPLAHLVANTAEMAIAAAVAGHGLTRVLSYQAARELRSGRLTLVLAQFEPPPIPIHVVHREGRSVSGRVRAFVDFAVDRLRADRSMAV
ncbi:LysR family transcriptional regulator [Desertibaculum subflavum]|uniref:LysR family transcriptional regulator n=1 Tax=Desertibaculum subflavum TaxID=2268458 RepID=UPI000E66459F